MKNILIYSVTLALNLVVLTGLSQSWLTQIPSNANGRLNYFETKTFVEQFREQNPMTPLKGEKQFLRSKFFLDGRIMEDGYLPSGTYWEEAKRIISERSQKRAEQSPWTFIGPDESTVGINSGVDGGSGRIDCIEFHPTDPDIFYVGAPCGGLWRTTDGGVSWEVLTDELPTLGISDIDFHPLDPNTLFICTGTRDIWWETFSVGILKSEDNGETWEETGLQYSIQQNRAVHELLINPSNPLIMHAATSVGLYRSEDGGDNWDRIVNGNFMELEQKVGDPSVIFATNFGVYNCNSRIYRSVDAGVSFQVMNTGVSPSQVNRITIGTTPADPEVIYALYSACSDHAFFGLYRSNDCGDTWMEAPNSNNINVLSWLPAGLDPGGQGYFTLSLAVDPADPDHVYTGGVNIWESYDGGDIWTLNAQYYGAGAQYVHADIHNLVYNPLNDGLYNTNDGGVYKFIEGPDAWVNISDGLHIMQFYRLGTWKEDETRMLGSPQDNGTVIFTDTLNYEILLAEACDNFIDYTDPDILYFGGYAAGINRSMNGGFNYTSIQPNGESPYRFNPPFIMHPTNEQVLYCAFTDVWRSDNRGNSWINLTSGLSYGNDYMSLEVAPSNTDYIYAATTSQIWRTNNGGGDWENIKFGLPGSVPISDIAISSTDPEKIWVTFQGWNSSVKVYSTEDGGESWQNVTMNLPNMPANCITYEPGSDDAVYVGTDIGVFYTNENLSEWIDYSRDLPNVIIDELEIHPLSGKILTATYGRGMWENVLADPATVNIYELVQKEMTVFPNPANNIIQVECLPPAPGTYTLTLINAAGQTVLQKEIRSAGMRISKQINLEKLSSGLYQLLLTGEGYYVSDKVIKR